MHIKYITEDSNKSLFKISTKLLEKTISLNRLEFRMFSYIYKELFHSNMIMDTVFISTSLLRTMVGRGDRTSTHEMLAIIDKLENIGLIESNQKYYRKKRLNGELRGFPINGFVEVRLTNLCISLLQTGFFVDVDYFLMKSLKLDASRRFYSFLKTQCKDTKNYFTIDYIVRTLGYTDKYKTTSSLKSKVIAPAIDEVNEKTDVNLSEISIKREGNSAIGIYFSIGESISTFTIMEENTLFKNDAYKKLVELGVQKDIVETALKKKPIKWIEAVLKWAEEKKQRAMIGLEKLNLSLFGGLVCKYLFDKTMNFMKLIIKKPKTKEDKEIVSNAISSVVDGAKKQQLSHEVNKDEVFAQLSESYKFEVVAYIKSKNDVKSLYNQHIDCINNDDKERIKEVGDIFPALALNFMAITLFRSKIITIGENILNMLLEKAKKSIKNVEILNINNNNKLELIEG